MDPHLLTYYEAIERASADMLNAARDGNWDEVVKLEGACVLLISQLKHAAQEPKAAHLLPTVPAPLPALPGRQRGLHMAPDATSVAEADGMASAAEAGVMVSAAEAARAKARIMQRILVNDAEIRQLAEPWLQTLDEALEGRRRTLH